MPDRLRVAAIAFTLLLTSLASVTPAAAGGLKVVIIVGPTEGQTADYISYAKQEAAVADAAGATVVSVYSPNATWAKVKAAVAGANVIIYHGHGNGYPNPYSATEWTDRVNGWNLNRALGAGDTGGVYCGEKALLGTLSSSDGADQWKYCGGSTNTDGIAPAANFVMIYANACYAPGAGEARPAPTSSVARSRVANYSYPALKLHAGAYFATDMGAGPILDAVLRSRSTSFGQIFTRGNGYDAGALQKYAHPDIAGDQVWIQKTYNTWLGTDYWYAYAGNPNATPDNGSVAPPPPPAPAVVIDRFAGGNRYETAASISAAQFDPSVAVAYVAAGTNFPDALAGGAAAAHFGGPMLLVAQDSLPSVTAGELQRLAPKRIVVLGGTASVSDAVLAQLKPYAGSAGSVQRISGGNRYETAALISSSSFTSGVPVAYVAAGTNFPDALAGVPASGVNGGPVLLVSPTAVPSATATELKRLQPGRIVILGGSGSVSAGVATALGAYASVTRLAGSDRYATSVAISKASFTSASVVYVATGATFPDALGGGPVAGITGGPLLLVATTALPASVATELGRLRPGRVVILGGTSVVSQSVADAIESLLG